MTQDEVDEIKQYIDSLDYQPRWEVYVYTHILGRPMVSWCIRTKTRRFQCTKFKDNQTLVLDDWMLRQSEIEPSEQGVLKPIRDDHWFHPFHESGFLPNGQPDPDYHPASKSTADSSVQSAASTI